MKKQIIIALVIFIALVAAAVLLIQNGPQPTRKPPQETVRNVTAIKASFFPFSPVINGYGEVKPDKTWIAIPQISGKIIEINPALQNGSFLKKGDLIAKLDTAEYTLALDKAKADIAKIKAEIGQYATRQKNLEAQIDILTKMLGLNKKNLERNRKLNIDHSISDLDLEKEELTVLQQENTILSMQAEINLLPSQIEACQAQLNAAETTYKQAQLNLTYTTITAPFDGRITEVSVTLYQFASAGSTLCKLDSIDMAEIETAFAPELLSLLPPREDDNTKHRNLLNDLTFTVETADQDAFRWNASFRRFSEKIDPNTRMVSLVLGIENPYAIDGQQPHLPLVRGLFCKVTIKARERQEIILPRQAIHDGSVYLVEDSKLVIRPVTVKYTLGTYAIIDSGIQQDDTVVISDIVPAIPGMKLSPAIQETYKPAL